MIGSKDNKDQQIRIKILNKWLQLKGRPPLTPAGFCNGDSTLFNLYHFIGCDNTYLDLTSSISSLSGQEIFDLENQHDEYMRMLANKTQPDVALEQAHLKFMEIFTYYEQIQLCQNPTQILDDVKQTDHAAIIKLLRDDLEIENQFTFSFTLKTQSELNLVLNQIINASSTNKMLMLKVGNHAVAIFYDHGQQELCYWDPNVSKKDVYNSPNAIAQQIFERYTTSQSLHFGITVLDKHTNPITNINKIEILNELIRERLEDKPEPNIVSLQQALSTAILYNDIETVACIILQCQKMPEVLDALILTKNIKTASPLKTAIKAERLEALESILNPNGSRYDSITQALRIAIDLKNKKIQNYLLTQYDPEQILVEAIQKNNITLVNFLINEQNLPVSEEAFVAALQLPKTDILSTLLQSESKPPNFSMGIGNTIMTLAAENSNLAAMNILLNHNIPLTLPSELASKILIQAAKHNHPNIIKNLYAIHQVNNNLNEDAIEKSMQWSANKGRIQIFSFLIKQGAPISSKTTYVALKNNRFPIINKCMEEDNVNFDFTHEYGMPPLMFFGKEQDTNSQITRNYLMQNGTTIEGYQDFAGEKGKYLRLPLEEFIEAWVKNIGLSPTTCQTDINGETPLFWAIQLGSNAIFDNILEPADLTHKDKNNKTAVDHAIESMNDRALGQLLQAGAEFTELHKTKLMAHKNKYNAQALFHVVQQSLKSLSIKPK